MDTSTQTGDENTDLDIDSTAALLLEKAKARATPAETIESEEVEVTEEIDDSIEVDTVIEAETDEVEAEPEGDAPESEEEARFETIAELADAIDVPLEEFLDSIKLTTKVSGEESEVTLTELKKGYQLEADYTRNNQEFIEERKKFTEYQEQSRAELQQQMQTNGAIFQAAQAELTNEFNSINWPELQAKDPTDYMLKRQKFGERQAQINNYIDQATQQANSFLASQEAEKSRVNQENLGKQSKLLMKAIPSWSNQETMNREAAQVSEYLSKNGFDRDELNNLSDHRIVLLARKAMAGDANVTSVDLAKKKVAKVPKLVKPNARPNQNLGKAKAQEKLRARFKGSGKTDDLAALLLNRRQAS